MTGDQEPRLFTGGATPQPQVPVSLSAARFLDPVCVLIVLVAELGCKLPYVPSRPEPGALGTLLPVLTGQRQGHLCREPPQ